MATNKDKEDSKNDEPTNRTLLDLLQLVRKDQTFKDPDRLSIVDDALDIISNKSPDSDSLQQFQYIVHTFINTLAGVKEQAQKIKQIEKEDKNRTKTVSEYLKPKVHSKVDIDKVKENEADLKYILVKLLKVSSSYLINGQTRDCLLGIILTNLDVRHLNFGVYLVQEGCLANLLDIGSEILELKCESSRHITTMTHSLVAAVLEKIYSCHDHDKVREIFRESVQDYINIKLRNPDMDDKTRAAKLFTILLQGPTEIGVSCIGREGMVEMLLAMVNGDDFEQQKAALDAIIAASCKKDKCVAFANLGKEVLNKLRSSNNDEIKLRALVGLSKIGSVGSTDTLIRPLGKETNISLANECRAVLKKGVDSTLKNYAIESLAYLSFDGDIKEDLVNDTEALDTLFSTLTNDLEATTQMFTILTIFVNLTNSYDTQEKAPELLELAKFAQQHIPQEHPKDSKESVDDRILRLSLTDLIPTLARISSKNITSSAKELMARILNAMAGHEDIRGRIVQLGGARILMLLAQDDIPGKYSMLASHALARCAITIDPELVYPGQKLIDVIKPIRRLLHPDCAALENFEGLLALTNIAQSNEDARTHILRNGGFQQIEALMFEEHTMIRRAAVQCVVNLITDPRVIALYEADNDRIKFLVISCQDDDMETVSAASGALAMICQQSEIACKKIFSSGDWCDILIYLLTHENAGFVHRAAVIVYSMVTCKDESITKKVFESKLFEVLLALSLPHDGGINSTVKELIDKILEEGKTKRCIKENSPNFTITEVTDEDLE